FTRAKDFGFSKTPEETERIWGDQVLEDMVRVIRTFRPNIVINNWGGVHGGHGHHQAAGLLVPIAVQHAADTNAYREQLKEGLAAWGGANSEVVVLDVERFAEKPSGYVLPLDDISPLWGKSWREIGLDAFANHKTQGISAFYGNPFFRRPIALKREDGEELDPKILGISIAKYRGGKDSSECASRKRVCEAMTDADQLLGEARTSALRLEWPETVDLLKKAAMRIDVVLPGDLGPRKPTKNDDEFEADHTGGLILSALIKAAGVQFSADAKKGELVAGDPFTADLGFVCRGKVDCPVETATICWIGS